MRSDRRHDLSQFENMLNSVSGSPPLPPTPPEVTSGDMDGWQQSVEKRLDSLDARAGRLEESVASVRVDMGIVKTKIDELPTKDDIHKLSAGITTKLIVLLAVIAALVAFADRIQAFLR